MFNPKLFLVVISLLLLSKGNLNAQNSSFLKDNSTSEGRIIIESGGSVSFHVSSFRAYKEEGITLKDWTRIALDISDAIDDNMDWRLEVQPLGNGGDNINELIGDYYGKKLDVSFLGISARPIVNPNGSISGSNIITELDGKQTLLSGRGNGRFVVLISYHIGTETPLLGQTADYYNVLLDFHLISD